MVEVKIMDTWRGAVDIHVVILVAVVATWMDVEFLLKKAKDMKMAW